MDLNNVMYKTRLAFKTEAKKTSVTSRLNIAAKVYFDVVLGSTWNLIMKGFGPTNQYTCSLLDA